MANAHPANANYACAACRVARRRRIVLAGEDGGARSQHPVQSASGEGVVNVRSFHGVV
jgi:hypothetical protein